MYLYVFQTRLKMSSLQPPLVRVFRKDDFDHLMNLYRHIDLRAKEVHGTEKDANDSHLLLLLSSSSLLLFCR